MMKYSKKSALTESVGYEGDTSLSIPSLGFWGLRL